MALDPASLIVSATALVATIAGARQAMHGRRDGLLQQKAANALEEREQKAAQDEAALKHAREDAEIAYTRLVAERAEVTRLAEERDRLERELRGQLRDAQLDRDTLRSIVADEVARESGRTADQIRQHESPGSPA